MLFFRCLGRSSRSWLRPGKCSICQLVRSMQKKRSHQLPLDWHCFSLAGQVAPAGTSPHWQVWWHQLALLLTGRSGGTDSKNNVALISPRRYIKKLLGGQCPPQLLKLHGPCKQISFAFDSLQFTCIVWNSNPSLIHHSNWVFSDETHRWVTF